MTAVLIDAHVHCHPSFGIGEFLSRARLNFTRAAESLGRSSDPVGLLALTEGRDEHSFERFSKIGQHSLPSGWRIERTREPTSLVAMRGEGMVLVLIAGQQIRLQEGLELLAVGGNPGLPDGRSLRAAVTAVRSAGAIPVLPWGFGKWWLHRGRIIERLLEQSQPDDLLLADSGSRAATSRQPRLLVKARQLGFRIIAGSDPLPLAREVSRPGSFGCFIEGAFSLDTPTAALRALLTKGHSAPHRFGNGRPLASFVRDQLELLLRTAVG